ncbi:tyrosine-type recombinase/integrase [Paludisphaera soli]|uniref:tyrosine-type recombinase/integrase n=1 Tax=Paludisphaera soli TaxID=2712865 RepID=UPI0013EA9B1A|nr:tyrosine-type recombinase/integrase [Paludisphaera soli]
MARPGAPWFWKAKQRWAATICGKQVLAPREIERDDRITALEWYAATVRAAAINDEAAGELTVGDGLEAYLLACRDRVAAGDLTPDAFRVLSCSLGVAARVVFDGSPFHAKPVAKVDRKQLDAVIANWATGRKKKADAGPGYLAAMRCKLQPAFRWMAAQGIVPAYTLGDSRMPTRSIVETEICSRATAAKWLRWLRSRASTEAHAQFLLLQRLLIRTGARPSELHRARWGDVAWDAARTPDGSAVGVITRAEWKSGKKTGQPRRILLPPTALRPLRHRFEAIRPAADDLIFRDPKGREWSASELARECRNSRNAAAAAGWDLPAVGPGRIRPYQWRHTAASKLIADGVALPTTARLLGTSVAMLLKTYVHTDAQRLLAAAMTLDRPRPVRSPATDASSEVDAGRRAARRPVPKASTRPRATAPKPRRPRA